MDSSLLPLLVEEIVVLPTNAADAEEASKVNYMFWWLMLPTFLVVAGLSFMIVCFVCKRKDVEKDVSLRSGHSDLRNKTTKELEAMSEEERDFLKKVLLASIRGETSAHI